MREAKNALISVALLVIALGLLSSCSQNQPNKEQQTNSTNTDSTNTNSTNNTSSTTQDNPENQKPDNPTENPKKELEIITISNEGSFSAEECSARGLEGKVIMLESAYCGACRSTMQNFLDACEEMNITPIILDLSQRENYQKMVDEYKIQIRWTPTFIFGCDYYIGAASKEEYIRRIEKMLS